MTTNLILNYAAHLPFSLALLPQHLSLPVSMLPVFGSAKLLAELFERLHQPGIVGEIIAGAAGWGLLRLWDKPPMESLFVGSALNATSVGITAQVLASKGLLSRTASKIILTAAVIDDGLALLVLGVVSSMADGNVKILELGLSTAFAVGFILLVAGWGSHAAQKILPGFERNYGSEKLNSRSR